MESSGKAAVESKMYFRLQTFAFAFMFITDFLSYFLTSATAFSSLERFELVGFECKNPVLSVDNAYIFSDVACAFKCSKIPACVAISYNPFTYECRGCFMFETNETSSQKEGKLFYGLLEPAKDVVNVAYGKPAYQSTTFEGAYAAKGVDGNTNQSHNFFHTYNTSGTSNWWYVDLQNTYILKEVKLFNRLDCCADRLKDIRVLLGNSLDNLTEVAFSSVQIDDIWTIPIPTITAARYVKLVHNGHFHLHLSEVQVFAIAARESTDEEEI